MSEYIVQKGDSLSKIAQKFYNNKMLYDKIAAYNLIKDPNKIEAGQSITVPTVDKTPLKLSQIPTKNKLQIIDNYSPNYNYIVEGNKVYYAIKGKDHWVDISDNKKAQLNLLKFLNDKYQFRGYEDNEATLFKQLTNPVVDSSNKNVKLIPKKNKKVNISPQNTTEKSNSIIVNSPAKYLIEILGVNPKNLPKSVVKSNSKTDVGLLGNFVNKVKDKIHLGINGVQRIYSKNISNQEEDISNLKYKNTYKAPNSNYTIQPQSFTGDTLFVNKRANPREYYLPESINLGDILLGARNRGDYTERQSEGAIITSLFPFFPYEKVTNKNGTFFGIDKNGKFKVGAYSDFGNGDTLAKTYANNVESFVTDNSGKILTKDDAAHGNPGRRVPIVTVVKDDGTKTKGSINILTNKNNTNTGTYGTITGGRVIMKAGNETRLVSGSIDNIKQAFEELKKRNKVPYVTFYTLDNGTFNRGLRMTDGKLTSKDLRNHDLKNTGGGNFLYILPERNIFSSDTIRTPNVRTVNDESYKNGHPITNSVKGIVNHHTTFMDPNLNSVVAHLTNPNQQVSSHVVIGYDGSRKILATPDQVTFHGGHSRWNGQNNVNDFMIGVEFQGDTNRKPLTDKQIQSYVEYVKPIIREYGIPYENIVTHQDVRDEYNKWAVSSKQPTAPSKPDINKENQKRILEALRQSLYIQK